MNKIANAYEEKRSELSDQELKFTRSTPTHIPEIEIKPTLFKNVVSFGKRVPMWFWGVLGGTSSIGLITLLVFIFFLNTHPVKVTVQSFTWERKIAIEAYEQRRRDGWDHPGDAYDINTSSRIHHYDQVYVGSTSYSCGTSQYPRTCSRANYISVPAYRTWYDYTVDRWEFDYWVVVTDINKNPQWPILPTTLNVSNVLGNERESTTRKESYKVLTDKGYVLAVKLPVYMQLQVGSIGTANVNRQNDVRSVNWDFVKS